MANVRLEARDYLTHLRSDGRILHLAMYKGEACVGRGQGLVLNDQDRVAIMLEDCGDPADTGVSAGYLVNYILHPEAASRP